MRAASRSDRLPHGRTITAITAAVHPRDVRQQHPAATLHARPPPSAPRAKQLETRHRPRREDQTPRILTSRDDAGWPPQRPGYRPHWRISREGPASDHHHAMRAAFPSVSGLIEYLRLPGDPGTCECAPRSFGSVPSQYSSWPGGGHGWWLHGFPGDTRTGSFRAPDGADGPAGRHRAAWCRTFRSKAAMHREDQRHQTTCSPEKDSGTFRFRARSELAAVVRAIRQANH